VVGYSAAPGQCGDNRPVRYGSSGGVWDLGTLGGANGQAQAINNLNEIVGYSETAGGANRATRWSNGVITNLGTLGGASFALATNDYSDAVGYYIDTFNQQRAAAWINGTLYDLNSIVQNRAGWRLLIATGINNSGQIVGQARNPAGKLRGFLLTPPCRSDFNGDGGIDGNDVTSFFISWENSMADADVNRDGGVDGGDIQVFFELWEAGRC